VAIDAANEVVFLEQNARKAHRLDDRFGGWPAGQLLCNDAPRQAGLTSPQRASSTLSSCWVMEPPA
jgi:hypothetical protein